MFPLIITVSLGYPRSLQHSTTSIFLVLSLSLFAVYLVVNAPHGNENGEQQCSYIICWNNSRNNFQPLAALLQGFRNLRFAEWSDLRAAARSFCVQVAHVNNCMNDTCYMSCPILHSVAKSKPPVEDRGDFVTSAKVSFSFSRLNAQKFIGSKLRIQQDEI